MSMIQTFLKELEAEAKTTRKMLSVIPDDKYQWKPHPKSMTIQQLATHIAELPTWVPMVFNTTELDFAASPYSPKEITSTAGLLQHFEQSLNEARIAFESARAEQLSATWILRNGEQILSKDSKEGMIRMTFSQIIHHRAQLGVFLRLLDVPIPGSYGPSADESFS